MPVSHLLLQSLFRPTPVSVNDDGDVMRDLGGLDLTAQSALIQPVQQPRLRFDALCLHASNSSACKWARLAQVDRVKRDEQSRGPVAQKCQHGERVEDLVKPKLAGERVWPLEPINHSAERV